MKVLTLSIFIIFSSNIKAQLTENNFDPGKLRNKIISISQKSIKKINPAFAIRDIEIVDGRFDSTIGYIKNIEFGGFLKLTIKNTDEIKKYFLSHISVSSADTAHKILCVIKKIILSNDIYESENGKTDDVINNFQIKSGGIIKLEFFVATGDLFIPLYRFDSTITGKASISVWTAGDYLGESLTASLNKLENISWNTIVAKTRRLSRNTIDSSIYKTFDLPLYGNPKKGIYNSFLDFINNNPVITEFSIVKNDKADFLYIKDSKNTETLKTNIWGYCDGKDFYIYSAENFFKLHPTGKTFTIYGAKDFTNVRVFRIHFGGLDAILPNSAYAKTKTRSKYALIHETLLLDMETGELF